MPDRDDGSLIKIHGSCTHDRVTGKLLPGGGIIVDDSPGGEWYAVTLTSDQVAATEAYVAGTARSGGTLYRRKISDLREEESLFHWYVLVNWIAVTTGVLLMSVYGGGVDPVDVWYDWPLAWAGTFGLVGIALTVVFGVTVFLHAAWWKWFGGGK